jgi:hypothetical protein
MGSRYPTGVHIQPVLNSQPFREATTVQNYTRGSILHSRASMSSIQSESPSDSTRNHSSHRHVEEGVLDDSNSSDSGDSEEEGKAE